MRIEMLKDRGYRGEHCAAGTVIEADAETAQWFIARGWAAPHAETAPLAPAAAEALVPTHVKRRKALR